MGENCGREGLAGKEGVAVGEGGKGGVAVGKISGNHIFAGVHKQKK